MKQIIFSNWNFMRFIRLGLGLVIVFQSVISRDWAMGVLGLIFSGLALFNIGCCGIGGCSMPRAKSVEPAKEIVYEEVVK